MKRIILGITLLFISSICFSSEFDDYEKRNKDDTALEGGSKFENTVVRNFWGDASFMRECASPDKPVPESFTIYIEVLTNGSVGDFVFTKNNSVTRCIHKHVKNKVFPSFGKPFMATINLKFTE